VGRCGGLRYKELKLEEVEASRVKGEFVKQLKKEKLRGKKGTKMGIF